MGQDIVILLLEHDIAAGSYSFAATSGGTTVACLDLYHYDQVEERAALGILVLPSYRGKGLGKRVLAAFLDYCRDNLQLHQVYCDVSVANTASLALFRSAGFVQSGLLKEWVASSDGRHDAYRFQFIFDDKPNTNQPRIYHESTTKEPLT